MNLQDLLISNKLTQSQLAEKLGISQSAVSQWQNKKNNPNLKYIKKLKIIFNLTFEELIKYFEK